MCALSLWTSLKRKYRLESGSHTYFTYTLHVLLYKITYFLYYFSNCFPPLINIFYAKGKSLIRDFLLFFHWCFSSFYFTLHIVSFKCLFMIVLLSLITTLIICICKEPEDFLNVLTTSVHWDKLHYYKINDSLNHSTIFNLKKMIDSWEEEFKSFIWNRFTMTYLNLVLSNSFHNPLSWLIGCRLPDWQGRKFCIRLHFLFILLYFALSVVLQKL